MNEELLEPRDVQCPYCGTMCTLLIDASQGSISTVEDCQRCCSPMQVAIEVDALDDTVLSVTVHRDDASDW
ncbi:MULTISPECIES: CPXCG motif-containing cysteine-rich protein [Larsenimonas]|uniref:CPXCG motif-containing cysteine-rich protein n=1 Tax=Larsenimonas suaedae TaxID=1851019 RepID=A0ABU1GS68_9GAMM|nr:MULTISPECIES: CPXCG motif-containing cysteine-rich protein [Larsenimonas]MCM2972333.1 CPXCG motif-containing cysteine-rich protein [Larsenimonas suaedae]MCM5704103.1 CPXCG motif-containing cysteine-rich protein [Larsenimonas salina]MDR5894871.1 CPXCG motif-containing cysteine-rich protein [Larsenimonas suaedae]